jgi:hypothetical protein
MTNYLRSSFLERLFELYGVVACSLDLDRFFHHRWKHQCQVFFAWRNRAIDSAVFRIFNVLPGGRLFGRHAIFLLVQYFLLFAAG